MQFANINDIVIHYQSIDAPVGRPTLVFSNSLGTDLRIWEGVISRLTGVLGLVVYDKRGHGLSDAPPAPYTIDDHVDDLAGLMVHLRLPEAIICGLSVGGIIAQGLYQKYPALVQALVLSDTGYDVGTPEMWNSRIETAEQDGIGSMADAAMERWFTPTYRAPGNAALAGYRNMLAQQSVAGYTGTMAVIRDVDFSDSVGDIKVPTLCVVGDQDLATPPAMVRDLASKISGARFEMIAGAGHLPCVEQPDAFVSVLRDFVDQLTDGATHV